MKLRKLGLLIGTFAITASFTGCSNEISEAGVVVPENKNAIEDVKVELTNLNVSYMPSKAVNDSNAGSPSVAKLPVWLRWIIFGAADAVGTLGGGVSGGCAASTLAWTVTATKDNQPQTLKMDSVKLKTTNTGTNEPAKVSVASEFKPNCLSGLQQGSAGYVHNNVIYATFENNKDIYEKTNEEVMTLVLDELEKQTGTTISDKEKASILAYTEQIISSFDTNKTVQEYFNELKLSTKDAKMKEALDVCCLIMEGLQYVDDSDTTYADTAAQIIRNSALESSLKTTLLESLSVADASARLWNTNAIKH